MTLSHAGVSGIFPLFDRPEVLTVLDVRPYSWEEQLTAACLQGLINRTRPRVYLIYDDVVDRRWLEIYKTDHGIPHRELATFQDLVREYASELYGFAVCHEEMAHTLNVAQTWGALHNAVPATQRVAAILEHCGMQKVRDFRGMFKTRIEAYQWAFDNLLPRCNKRILGHNCTEGWYLAKTHRYIPHIKDYLVAVQAFTFDLSARKRDRAEYQLFEKILSAMPEDGALLGWHCAKCWESEYVALAARHGFFVLCNLRSPNYSAHAGVRTPGFRFTQKHASPASIKKVEHKVYVTFIHSDGDAIWAENNFYAHNWLDSQRGRFPCTWEMQPYALDLAPGQLEYYYRTRSDKDYFIAGPSGAGYTAPIINGQRRRFLENTQSYLKRCGLRSILIMNRDPYQVFEELDTGTFPSEAVQAIPEALGFIHGYGGNSFAQSEFAGEVPYVQTTQFVTDNHDIYDEVAKFSKLVSRRPLFVAVHVRESANFASLRSTCDRLDPDIFKVVNVDEFLLTIRKAREMGALTELSVTSPELERHYRKRTESWWAIYWSRLMTVASVVEQPEDRMLRELRAANMDLPWTREELADILGWETIDPMLRLLRAGLQVRGLHVNAIDKAAAEFVRLYSDIHDVGVVMECLDLWGHWLERTPKLDAMRVLARRVIAVARELRVKIDTPVGD